MTGNCAENTCGEKFDPCKRRMRLCKLTENFTDVHDGDGGNDKSGCFYR